MPQDFAELVKEYQYRMIWELVTLTVFAVILLIVAIISARYIIHNQENNTKEDCLIIATGANMVSPAYSLLESLLQ